MAIRTYTAQQAAKLLRVTELTIWRWVKAKRLPDRRIPGTRKLIFLHDDLFPTHHNGNSVTPSQQ